MRTVHWLFVVSVLLFISGIGFIIASARTRQGGETAAAPTAVTALPPVASVKQIMTGIVMPAAYVVFDSVSTIVDAKGVQENQPRTDEEWARVGANAAAIIESANMLLIGNRAVDQGDWVKMSKAMADAGQIALKAATDKKPEGILEAGEAINQSCDNCHQKYSR
jgi:hypothetical protein